jgi:triacylglycerol lipase
MSMVLALVLLVLLLALGVSVVLFRRRTRRIEAPWLVPEPQQHAIVLAHGLLGFDHLAIGGLKHHYFRGIARHLATQGAVVLASRVKPMGTVPERAQALAEFVSEIDERRVLVIGHSMGGLDARYALSKLGLAARVSALVTVATPHRGSCLANTTLPLTLLRGLLGRVGVTTDAIQWLGEASSGSFNEDVPDAPDVFYGCIVGETTRARVLSVPLLLASYELLLRLRGKNDGLVPSSSQRWGRELQVVPAHHFEQIGWSPLFDANTMYLQLLRDLDAAGFSCLPTAARGRQAVAQS